MELNTPSLPAAQGLHSVLSTGTSLEHRSPVPTKAPAGSPPSHTLAGLEG